MWLDDVVLLGLVVDPVVCFDGHVLVPRLNNGLKGSYRPVTGLSGMLLYLVPDVIKCLHGNMREERKGERRRALQEKEFKIQYFQ